MMSSISELTLDSWTAIVKLADHLDVGYGLNATYVFRGQEDADWRLTPSLHCAVTKDGRTAIPALGSVVHRVCSYVEVQGYSRQLSPGCDTCRYNCGTRLVDLNASLWCAHTTT